MEDIRERDASEVGTSEDAEAHTQVGEADTEDESQVASLGARIGEMEAQLQEASNRIFALEEELVAAQASAQALEERTHVLEGETKRAVSKYRGALLAVAPEVPQELVGGETLDEVEESLAAARKTVEMVRQRLLSQAALERVPLGAPVRGALDLSGLSSKDKISAGLVALR